MAVVYATEPLANSTSMFDPFNPVKAHLSRPKMQRSNSAISLPSPPASPDSAFAEAEDLQDPFLVQSRSPPTLFTRPRTNRPKHFDRIQRHPPQYIQPDSPPTSDEMSLDTPPRHSIRDSPSNPFVEDDPHRVRMGKSLPKPGPIVTYVFRGKRIKFDGPIDDTPEDETFALCKPKLLFPHPPSPPRMEPVLKQSPSPPRFGVIPPTPVSIRKSKPPPMRFNPYVRNDTNHPPRF